MPPAPGLLAAAATPLAAFSPSSRAWRRQPKRLQKTLPPALDGLRRLDAALACGGRDRERLEALVQEARESRAEWQELLTRYAGGELKATEEAELGTERERYLELAGAAHDAPPSSCSPSI